MRDALGKGTPLAEADRIDVAALAPGDRLHLARVTVAVVELDEAVVEAGVGVAVGAGVGVLTGMLFVQAPQSLLANPLSVGWMVTNWFDPP